MIALDEYLSTAYDPDCEYVDGELVERNVGESDHSALRGIVSVLLYNQRNGLGVHVFPSLRVQVGASRCLIPDICVTTQKVRGKILREPSFLMH